MKFKKSILAAGSLAAVVTPLASVVACGTGADGVTITRYDSNAQSEITIQTTFASTGYQWDALQAVANAYNEAKKSTPGFKKVKLVHAEGGNGSIVKSLQKNFLAHEKDTVPNMVIDYADSAGQIRADNMQLDLSGTEGQLSKDFLAVNDQIGANEDGKILFLPISQSAEMISINVPLLDFLIKQAGGKVDEASFSNNWASKIGNDFDKKDSDGNYKGWKEAKNKTLENATVTAKDFQSYEKLFTLSDKLAKSQNLAKGSMYKILGLDSPTNVAYEIAFGKLGYDKDKFLYTTDKSDHNYINYTFLQNTKSEEAKEFKNTLKMIADAISNNSTVINGGGAYTSSSLDTHMTAIAVGSTAGYSHNFIKASANAKLPVYNSITLTGDLLDTKSTKVSDEIIATFGDHHNSLYKAGKMPATDNYDKQVDQKFESKVEDFVKNAGTSTLALVSKDIGIDKKIKDVDKQQINDTQYLVKSTGTIDKATSTLQENELLTLPMLSKANDGDKGGFVFTQGPGVFGIHHNDASDKAVRLFLTWFTSKDTKATFTKTGHAKDANDVSPIHYWAENSEYLVKTDTGFEGKPDDASNAYTAGNFYASQAIESMPKNNLLLPGSDEYSSLLRLEIDSQIRAAYNSNHNGNAITADKIYNDIYDVADTDGIIE